MLKHLRAIDQQRGGFDQTKENLKNLPLLPRRPNS